MYGFEFLQRFDLGFCFVSVFVYKLYWCCMSVFAVGRGVSEWVLKATGQGFRLLGVVQWVGLF